MARADIQLNSFLDRLDYNIDYERDDYATIYVSDTIERLLETPLEDIYDPVGSTAGADATYSLPPVELEDNTNDFEPVSLGEAAQILDGTTTVIPSFQSITDIGNIDLYNEPYRIVRFFEGTLSFVVDTSLQYEVNPFLDVGLLLTHRVAHHFQYSNLVLSTNLGIYDFLVYPLSWFYKKGVTLSVAPRRLKLTTYSFL